ncbi:hypothetical protein GALL_328340 [mine drainage metagenome]|uniref:Uncharacterized protein n=1 Tax=mine drainage metagenome TaxID=410659 RepID=A0A1J5QPP5_9ZZZZ
MGAGVVQARRGCPAHRVELLRRGSAPGVQRQSAAGPGQRDADAPHAGVAPFLDARRGVVDLDAGAHVGQRQREHVGQRHVAAGAATGGELVAGDDVVEDDAGGGGHRHQHVHHLPRIARARAELDAAAAQQRQRVDGAGDRLRVQADFLDLHRHEARVDRVDVGLRRRAAEALTPLRGDIRIGQQGLDVRALGQPHRRARLLRRDRDVEGREGVDEDLRRRDRAEIDHRSSPVEDDSVDRRVRHCGSVRARQSAAPRRSATPSSRRVSPIAATARAMSSASIAPMQPTRKVSARVSLPG